MSDFQKGDIVKMKKAHPCGENRWKILRYGADVKLRCLGCGRDVLLERPKFRKHAKKVK